MFTIRKSVFLTTALMSIVFQGTASCQDKNKLLQIPGTLFEKKLYKTRSSSLPSPILSSSSRYDKYTNQGTTPHIKIKVWFCKSPNLELELAEFLLINFTQNLSIKTLKTKVLNALSLTNIKNVPTNKKVLVRFYGEILNEKLTINDCKISDGDRINMTVKGTPKTFTIKTITGKSEKFLYDQMKCATVKDIIRVACILFDKSILKQFSYLLIPVKPKIQKALDYTKTLSELGIQPNAELTLFIKKRSTN